MPHAGEAPQHFQIRQVQHRQQVQAAQAFLGSTGLSQQELRQVWVREYARQHQGRLPTMQHLAMPVLGQ